MTETVCVLRPRQRGDGGLLCSPASAARMGRTPVPRRAVDRSSPHQPSDRCPVSEASPAAGDDGTPLICPMSRSFDRCSRHLVPSGSLSTLTEQLKTRARTGLMAPGPAKVPGYPPTGREIVTSRTAPGPAGPGDRMAFTRSSCGRLMIFVSYGDKCPRAARTAGVCIGGMSARRTLFGPSSTVARARSRSAATTSFAGYPSRSRCMTGVPGRVSNVAPSARRAGPAPAAESADVSWCVRSQGGGSPAYWTYSGDSDNAASVRHGSG